MGHQIYSFSNEISIVFYFSILHLGTNNLRYKGEPLDILHYYEEIVRYANTIPNAHIIITGTEK